MNQQTILTAAHWGAINVTVENGVAVSSESAIASEIPNPLTTVVPDQIYSDARVRYPMVRKNYLAGNTDTSLRGRDEWVRISWDDALDLVHRKLMENRQQYGDSAIFAGSYGWYSCGSLHASRTLLQRYMNLTGGFTGTTGDYSTGAVQVIMPHVLGGIEVYEPQTSWQQVLEHTEILVLWGANPLTTLQISWTAAEPQGRDYLSKLKNSGKRVICLDPIRNETAKLLNAEWIPLHTATDVPLMLGIAYSLIQNDLHDCDFLTKYTVGFEKFKDYLLGKEDGIAKSAEWASHICGVPAQTIEQLARDFSAHRTMIIGSWGIQRQRHGEQAHWALAALCAMLGQIGQDGGGFVFNYRLMSGGLSGLQAVRLGAISAKVGESLGQKEGQSAWLVQSSQINFPVARIADALLNPHKTIDFNGRKITYPELKVVYWAGGNPFAHHQDTNLLVKAWHKPDTIIVNEINWTPTARMADIVLPVTTSYERNDLTMIGDYATKHIVPMKQVVEPQFEAKSDYWIFQQLAKRAGVESEFTENKNEMQWLAQFYETARQNAEKAGISMPAFEQFWADNKLVSFENQAETQTFQRFRQFRSDPMKNPLKTPSGKIEIFSETVAAMNYDDCLGHPTWFEPEEYKGNTNADYPLALVTPHLPYRLHSQLAATSLRHQYAVNDREPVLIHPEDAAQRGIKSGDIVRLFNPRGQILCGAVVSDNIIKGTVAVHEGAWFDPQDLNTAQVLCKNGNPNVLTRDEGTSKLAQGNSSNTTILQLEKYQAEAPEIQVLKAPHFIERG
ncbi:trimethylamine N-oxide reductase I catalytic subunit [Bibersteinia trehalosi Y31]|uniref:Trimethylamine N-oxide reductase I catalytic subunit n=1 Tax=Bibersteinia trehalosi Y31 TaxID=1261658 RepID=A0A179CXZ4_BIBTR|nr:molybdopterin guanine dinucleotide-containing S/N-oxide reductase [Bibersteinia trehalosi]OAQ14784.1 trimethylamine N-oxide reductase I catalytic subunit [Bibersteinia trehalosi Y31]